MDSRSTPFIAYKKLVKNKKPRNRAPLPKDGGARFVASWDKNYLQSNDRRAYVLVNSKRFPVDLTGKNFKERQYYVESVKQMLDDRDREVLSALEVLCG